MKLFRPTDIRIISVFQELFNYRATILVFPHQTEWQYYDGDPRNGGVECKGVWKNHDFGTISHFIAEMMQDRAIVTMGSK